MHRAVCKEREFKTGQQFPIPSELKTMAHIILTELNWTLLETIIKTIFGDRCAKRYTSPGVGVFTYDFSNLRQT